MAHRALLDLKPLNTDQILTGPESLTYTDVRNAFLPFTISSGWQWLTDSVEQIANTLSDVLGTKVEHVSLEPDAFREKLSDFGLTAEMSEYMTDLDVRVAQGVGKEVSPAVEKVTGSRALTFREFAERIKHVWQ